jgi:phosphohistidine swiveling domain-containing protein
MFFRKTFTEEWSQKNAPVFWVEMIHRGDVVEMPKLFGFSFGEHCFISRNQTTTFYANNRTQQRALKWGKLWYNKTRNLSRLLHLTVIADRHLCSVLKNLRKLDLKNASTHQLYSRLEKIFIAYARFIAVYRFTRPSFYNDLVLSLQLLIPKPTEQNLSKLLSSRPRSLQSRVPTKMWKLTGQLKKVGERRLAMHTTYMDSFKKVYPLFVAIGRKLGVSSSSIQNTTLDELRACLLDDKPFPRRAAEARLFGYKFIYRRRSFFISIRYTSIGRASFRDSTPVKLVGQVACTGHIQGRVRVIEQSLRGITYKEAQHMRHGEILVTSSTSPDMMLAINKASAIVTDVGGQLSHAAIVSRELRIPCVIGTMRASKVFHDGDFIEVDAYKGIVRKL